MNRVERRAVLLATWLVVLAVGARLAGRTGRADVSWQPGPGELSGGPAGLGRLTAEVERELLREERAHTPLAPGERIDPNRAPAEELRRLPGVGPARASAIVEGRSAGPYAAPEDLLRVPGIGPATLARLAPHLRFSPAARALPDGMRDAAWDAGRTAPPGHGCPAAAGATTDLNAADSATLVELPGIGPARARSLLRARARRGGFHAWEQLLEVPGIGPRTLDRLRAAACLGPPPLASR